MCQNFNPNAFVVNSTNGVIARHAAVNSRMSVGLHTSQ
jgi:hypothetical protein